MTGCSVTRKAPSFRRSSDVTPAVEEIDLNAPSEIDKLLSVIDFVNMYGYFSQQLARISLKKAIEAAVRQAHTQDSIS